MIYSIQIQIRIITIIYLLRIITINKTITMYSLIPLVMTKVITCLVIIIIIIAIVIIYLVKIITKMIIMYLAIKIKTITLT